MLPAVRMTGISRIDPSERSAPTNLAQPEAGWAWLLSRPIFLGLRATRRRFVEMFPFADPFPCFSFRIEGFDNARLSACLHHLNVASRSPLVVEDAVNDFGHRVTPLLASSRGMPPVVLQKRTG